jgi:ribulose-phosphate 3-epimerase
MPGLLSKIEQARELCSGRPIEIEVDGGINLENIGPVARAGATIFVVGRAVWGSDRPTGAIAALRQAADAAIRG